MSKNITSMQNGHNGYSYQVRVWEGFKKMVNWIKLEETGKYWTILDDTQYRTILDYAGLYWTILDYTTLYLSILVKNLKTLEKV